MSASATLDSSDLLHAGRDLLSLALMDARNHTLQLLGRFEQVLGDHLQPPPGSDVVPPLWLAGHVGWLAEYWIARNPQRGMGAACDADALRLASVEPQADRWFNPLLAPPAERSSLDLPDAGAVKAYLLDTLETMLELLEKTPEDDRSLYFFRMALFHEDVRGEQLIALAQELGVALDLRLPPGAQSREPIGLPATRWRLGMDDAGFAPAIEQGVYEEPVPEFEIDAQPVSWSQYVEFIDDDGYDREDLWSPEGWRWLQARAQAEGRRGPRHVEQIGVASGAVLQSLFGKATRMGGGQSVLHACWWEADAYARWAGRRLPTEVEWEIAAHQAARRGFRWGDVREWTAGTLRPWPGYRADPWAVSAELLPDPVFGRARVLRGASFATRARMKHLKSRRWALPDDDQGFVGFRTCAI
jgi:ergothioneine biosynthesis protein EgtB